MSSINFEIVSNQVPELSDAVAAIKGWIEQHSNREYFDALTLAQDLNHVVSADKIIRVLVQLVSHEQMSVRYRVRFSDGSFSEDEFCDPSEIGNVIYDSSFRTVEVDRDMIVPIYSAKVPA